VAVAVVGCGFGCEVVGQQRQQHDQL